MMNKEERRAERVPGCRRRRRDGSNPLSIPSPSSFPAFSVGARCLLSAPFRGGYCVSLPIAISLGRWYLTGQESNPASAFAH